MVVLADVGRLFLPESVAVSGMFVSRIIVLNVLGDVEVMILLIPQLAASIVAHVYGFENTEARMATKPTLVLYEKEILGFSR